MKKVKIKICNYDPNDTCSYGYYITNILKKYYDVEFSETPDYLFYNESNYEHLKYNCIKIFYTGENIHPNFNLCDYAIGFDYMNFGDRYYRLPIYFVATFYRELERNHIESHDFTAQLKFTKDDLDAKTEFCSFVYSNYLGDTTREAFFNKLSTYKKVKAGGVYLNNIGERVEDKLEFEKNHKFSIAFENSSRAGYTTEKLPTALMAKTIPIYWGNPEISKEFNTRRFINCHEYENFDQVVARIKEIDNDTELYIRIMNEPVKTTYDFELVREGFESFLRNIIEQPFEQARRRRINPVRAKEIEKNEALIAKYTRKQTRRKKILATLYKPFKRIPVLETLKQKYFARKLLKK